MPVKYPDSHGSEVGRIPSLLKMPFQLASGGHLNGGVFSDLAVNLQDEIPEDFFGCPDLAEYFGFGDILLGVGFAQ